MTSQRSSTTLSGAPRSPGKDDSGRKHDAEGAPPETGPRSEARDRIGRFETRHADHDALVGAQLVHHRFEQPTVRSALALEQTVFEGRGGPDEDQAAAPGIPRAQGDRQCLLRNHFSGRVRKIGAVDRVEVELREPKRRGGRQRCRNDPGTIGAGSQHGSAELLLAQDRIVQQEGRWQGEEQGAVGLQVEVAKVLVGRDAAQQERSSLRLAAEVQRVAVVVQQQARLGAQAEVPQERFQSRITRDEPQGGFIVDLNQAFGVALQRAAGHEQAPSASDEAIDRFELNLIHAARVHPNQELGLGECLLRSAGFPCTSRTVGNRDDFTLFRERGAQLAEPLGRQECDSRSARAFHLLEPGAQRRLQARQLFGTDALDDGLRSCSVGDRERRPDRALVVGIARHGAHAVGRDSAARRESGQLAIGDGVDDLETKALGVARRRSLQEIRDAALDEPHGGGHGAGRGDVVRHEDVLLESVEQALHLRLEARQFDAAELCAPTSAALVVVRDRRGQDDGCDSEHRQGAERQSVAATHQLRFLSRTRPQVQSRSALAPMK